MKYLSNITVSCLIVCLLSSEKLFSQNKEIPVESTIKEVTVFLQHAQITRSAKVNLHAGSNTIKLIKLSPYIIPSSIQIEGNPAITIASVNHRNNYTESGNDDPEVKKLTKKLEQLETELLINQAWLNAYNEEKNLYDANKNFSGNKKSPTADNYLDMTEFYSERYTEVNKKILELTFKQEDLTQQKINTGNQLNALINTNNKNCGEIILNLSAHLKTTVEITFSYVVTQASWEALYDIKAVDNKSPIELTYKAKVVQRCGEDWNQVKLKLSTGNPGKNNNKPTLGIWALNGYTSRDVNKAKKLNSMPQDQFYNNTEMDKIQLSEVVIAGNTSTGINGRNTSIADFTTGSRTTVSTEFTIAIPYSIKSDGKVYTVEIQKNQLQAEYSYYAAPKYDKSAFLIAGILGWEQYNLISGWVNTYFTDSYIGQSYINPQQTEDTLNISLGRDKAILLERKKIKDYTQRSGGSAKKITLGIEITIRNTKSAIVKLELEDQIPVSKQKDIEVELLEKSDAKYNKEDGSLKWNLTLAPGENRKVKFTYSVKYPKDKELSNF